jgi:cysteine desulfuration protein SufE
MEDQNNQIFYSCLKKQKDLQERFALCASPEQKYEKIIELGRSLPPLPEEERTPENLVKGCQSQVFLASHLQDDGTVKFHLFSEALISSGLAMLLLEVYDGECPETILKCPPAFLEALGLHATLSPSRAGGLAAIYLRMKQEVLKYLI